MGLEEIITNIESDTNLKVKQIIDNANSEADGIKSKAGAEAQATADAARMKADNDSRQILMRETSRANIEANGLYQDAVTRAIRRSMEQIEGSMPDYMRSDGYAKLLNKLAKAATDQLGEGCVIYVRKADIGKLKTQGPSVRDDPNLEGGLRAESSDGKMSVDYSIGRILDGISDRIAVKLLKQIQE